MNRSFPTVSLLVFLACLAAAHAPGQVPDGWYIAASFRKSAAVSGPGGVFLGHPLNPGAGLPVAGLPPEVTGAAWPAAGVAGADMVVRRPSDGAVITNGWAFSGVQMPLFVLSFSGTPATGISSTTLNTINLGTIGSQTRFGTAQAALLPDERLVICVDQVGIAPQPLAGQFLGLVDLSAGTVAPIPVTSVIPASAGVPNAVAFDANAGNSGIIYLGMHYYTSTVWQSSIYAVPFNNGAGGPATLITSLPSFRLTNLAVESGGTLVAAGTLYTGGTPPYQARIHRVGTGLPPLTPPLRHISALTIEHVTGDYLVTGTTAAGMPFEVHRIPLTGTTMLLGTAPAGGWSNLAGIDLNPDPEIYGPSTPTPCPYQWMLGPNPGGLPVVGNLSFSLTVTCSGTPSPGLWAASAAALSPTLVGGFYLNIDPGQVVLLNPLAGTSPETIPLPIPWFPALSGTPLFFQTVHFDPVIAATPGLHLTIL